MAASIIVFSICSLHQFKMAAVCACLYVKAAQQHIDRQKCHTPVAVAGLMKKQNECLINGVVCSFCSVSTRGAAMLDSELGATEVDSSFPPNILTSGRVSDFAVGQKVREYDD